MALTPFKALRLGSKGIKGGGVMREGCKSSGASEARGSDVGERRREGFLTGVRRCGEGDESDWWGPIDRETRERRPAREGVI
jgi:hypothetical protein